MSNEFLKGSRTFQDRLWRRHRSPPLCVERGRPNVVVANMGTTETLTFSADGKVTKTENAGQAGSDGLVNNALAFVPLK